MFAIFFLFLTLHHTSLFDIAMIFSAILCALFLVACPSVLSTSSSNEDYQQQQTPPSYDITPNSNAFGATITNLNITHILRTTPPDSPPPKHLISLSQSIKQDLHTHRYLHFKGQGKLPWEAQLSFMQLFGPVVDEVRCNTHIGHNIQPTYLPQSPHPPPQSSHVNRREFHGEKDPRVAVFSNNPQFGLPSVGVEGFHCDGNVMEIPHAATLLFCERTIPNADTILSPLNEVAAELILLHGKSFPFDLADVLFASSHVDNLTQPLIYPHPLTGNITMFFGLGTLSGRYHLKNGTVLSQEWTDAIVAAIDDVISRHTVNHEWVEGDMVMLDNLALAHKASSATQAENGVRILRRVTLKGTNLLQHRQEDGLESFPHRCSKTEEVCLVSLASWVGYEDGSGKFHSNAEAGESRRRIEACRTILNTHLRAPPSFPPQLECARPPSLPTRRWPPSTRRT